MAMKEKNISDEIKKEGKVLKGEASKDKTYSSERDFGNEKAATAEFLNSKKRLFDVNSWTDIPGIANAAFALYSPAGEAISRLAPEKGDFIRIDLPGPLPMYWVEVTEVSDGEDRAEFIVKPSADPTANKSKEVTEHFFQDSARSIFRVERLGYKITGSEIGIDEAINNEESEAGNKAKAAMNTVVSEGAWAGFQKYQWKNLTDYLVGIGEGE